MKNREKVEELVAGIILLGDVSLDFGKVNRVTKHQDGATFESDTDHTVMLSLLACSLSYHFPNLHTGRVAEFALVHDLVEVYAGDTSTIYPLSESDAQRKDEKEQEALQRLVSLFSTRRMPWVCDRIRDYMRQDSAEARFVRAVDKLCPHITGVLNRGVTARDAGMSIDEYVQRYVESSPIEWARKEFALIVDIYQILAEYVVELRREIEGGSHVDG